MKEMNAENVAYFEDYKFTRITLHDSIDVGIYLDSCIALVVLCVYA